MDDKSELQPRPRYRWPWIALALLIFGVVLAILWMSAEVRRMRSYRETDLPSVPPSTNF